MSVTALLAVVLTFGISVCRIANASEDDAIETENDELSDLLGTKEGITVFGSTVIRKEQFMTLAGDVANQFNQLAKITYLFADIPPDDGADTGSDSAFFYAKEGSLKYNLLHSGVSPIKLVISTTTAMGVALILVYTVIGFYLMIERQDQSYENMTKLILKFVVAALFVIYLNDILTGIDRFGSFIWQRIAFQSSQTRTDGLQNINQEVLDQVSGMEMSPAGMATTILVGSISETFEMIFHAKRYFSTMGIFLIGRIVLFVTYFMIMASGYGILIELVIRRAMAPFAAASMMVHDAPRSNMILFLKGYFSVYLRMAAFILIITLTIYIQTWAETASNADLALQTNAFGLFGVMICARIAGRAAITASGSIIRAAVGGEGGED